MKKEIADKWAGALESGKFVQNYHSLGRYFPGGTSTVESETHCAYGVLCELAHKELGPATLPKALTCGYIYYDDNDNVLPQVVADWAGISINTNAATRIVTLNDTWKESFETIAAFIRTYAEEI